MRTNADKLAARYPKGYSDADSVARRDEDNAEGKNVIAVVEKAKNLSGEQIAEAIVTHRSTALTEVDADYYDHTTKAAAENTPAIRRTDLVRPLLKKGAATKWELRRELQTALSVIDGLTRVARHDNGTRQDMLFVLELYRACLDTRLKRLGSRLDEEKETL